MLPKSPKHNGSIVAIVVLTLQFGSLSNTVNSSVQPALSVTVRVYEPSSSQVKIWLVLEKLLGPVQEYR